MVQDFFLQPIIKDGLIVTVLMIHFDDITNYAKYLHYSDFIQILFRFQNFIGCIDCHDISTHKIHIRKELPKNEKLRHLFLKNNIQTSMLQFWHPMLHDVLKLSLIYLKVKKQCL